MSRPKLPIRRKEPLAAAHPAGDGLAGVLRQRAEDQFKNDAGQPSGKPAEPLPRAVQQLVHELQVHQIELELQNDQLRQSRLALDNARARYFDLYDLAPVGYVTVGASGLILEANLTAATLLGVARSALVRRHLHAFVAKEEQDNFYLLCRQLRETCAPQSCEVRMNRPGGPRATVLPRRCPRKTCLAGPRRGGQSRPSTL